jgi:hypothetical protein
MTRQHNHELKLDRALHHLQSLEKEAAAWLKRKPYRFVHDFDFKTGEKLMVIELLEPVPPEFATITGDCLHNLRAALDNLVYQLAVRYLDIGPLPSDFRRSEFPIFTNRPMNAGECRNTIGCIHPRAQTIIKELQPHKTREAGENPASHVLAILHDLSVKDKHRFPHLGVLNVGTISFNIPDPYAIPARPVFSPVVDRAIVLRYLSAPDAWAEVNMQRPPSLYIAFGEGSPKTIYRAPVESVLTEIHKWMVDKIFPQLVPYLD